jgi:tellurite methyltransferase
MERFSEEEWRIYYDAMKGLPPRETVVFALDRLDEEGIPAEERFAVDLGCGEGRDTNELLRRAGQIWAIDGGEDGLRRLRERAQLLPGAAERLITTVRRFQELAHDTVFWSELPSPLLINAGYALPFCPPESFPALWARITETLPSGGRFSGQFFGNHDGWAGDPSMTHHTRAEAEALLAGFTVEQFLEEERDGTTIFGKPKHWHAFHVVIKKI